MEIASPRFASVILVFFTLSLLSTARVQGEDAGWIDEPTANSVLPYAYMSRDVSGADATPIGGWTRIADWKTIFSKGGLPADMISSAERVGFSAALYRNSATGELTIAYRETKGLLGWATDVEAGVGKVPGQYHFAAALATLVKTQYPKAPSITATGYSLGGGLATYASQHSPGITKVLTFNSARPPIVSSATAGHVTQINIAVPGELVGDPNTKSDVGLGSLPGKTYSIRSTTETAAGTLPPSQLKSIVTTHKLEGVIGGLEAVKSVKADLQGGKPSGIPSGGLTGSPGAATEPARRSSQSPSSQSQATASTNASAPSGVAAPILSGTQQRGQLPMSADTPRQPTVTGFAPMTIAKPGGVSLSRAAADRMPLEIALDASAVADGKIVLSGRASRTRMDAALFLTALRAACDDRDPYFSLDPDNGALWSQQGDQASNDFWEKIKKDFPSDTPARAKNTQPGINIRTVSATQDYPSIWNDISPRYPNFRAKLVFYPEWLRQTRLGEVLYKADVLLKEISSGVSILGPGKLRASAIPGYLSADFEYAAKGLLAGTREQAISREWRGSRLWFEITPSELPTTMTDEAVARPSVDDPALRSLLHSKGLIRSADQSVRDASFFVRHGSVFDLSQVNPIMFVRVHDHATNKDLSDHDPRLDGLAMDVSRRFDQYAEYYDELKLLRDIVRAYIAARKITEANDRLCGTLDTMPLLDSEKLATKLPEYHTSELFVTIASYSAVSRKGSQTQFVKASSMSGGVSIAGQKFVETAMRDGETTVTRSVEAALAGVNLDQPVAIDSDRKLISFVVDDRSGAPIRLASTAGDPIGLRNLSDYPIENEPNAAANPFARQNGQGGNRLEWSLTLIGAFLTILALGLLFNHVARKRPIARS
ncbi:DUF2974 domain-containing protein [Bradyrhizobium sp. 197]|uniref:Mbeg1-like protein n=1 Tax=Bradyrhizobium sp. 197 TaxID=2782663 RepID=UPI001FFA1E47|nr:Mbeg1-like protein [Bradyrhizobium sp. 197]MCK1481004.1 DUF2974 domain-containing protein [Bradyrhizobium sp. 197]